MSGAFGSQQWMYASGGFYPYELDNSLKFEDGDSPYLRRDITTTSNRKTFTYSCWFKRGNLGVNVDLFTANITSGTSHVSLNIDTNDRISWRCRSAGTSNGGGSPTMVLRDPSAWYHIVYAVDTTEATNTDRVKIWVNGESVDINANNYPTQNSNLNINVSGSLQLIGAVHYNGTLTTGRFDGYLTEVNFIDGTALTPSSFGETKEGIWIPKDPTGLTYGTNGFRLPFTETTTAEGFNTVTYTGTSSGQSIEGVGFQPDLVWVKSRGTTNSHNLFDSIRGAGYMLSSDDTAAEIDNTAYFTGFESDGFTVALNGGDTNFSGYNYVAWCWDAGTGSAASNTDGSITSTVKANQDYGFSIVSYTGNGVSNASVGHGLGVKPSLAIHKNRSTATTSWQVNTDIIDGSVDYLKLEDAAVKVDIGTLNAPTSSVIHLTNGSWTNTNSDNYIAYCFADVTGHQKIGTYSGTGSSGNAVTTGFRPAFLMIKNTTTIQHWVVHDSTRSPSTFDDTLLWSTNQAENTVSGDITFTDTGFTLDGTANITNGSGDTYIYLAIADTRDAAFWTDASGNGNDWEPVNLQHSDVMPDTPTDGFAVMNPVDKGDGTVTYSEGNLKVSVSDNDETFSSIGMSSGQWYWEIYYVSSAASNNKIGLGIADADNPNNNEVTNNGHQATTYATGDILAVAVDVDSETFSFYKNGSIIETNTDWSSKGWATIKAIATSSNSAGEEVCIFNFGQDSSFNANKVAQGNADENGKGDFYYAPPSGYLALCNANLPDPAIDPNKGDNPEDYFNTVLWTGNGTSQSITGVGFSPEFTWVKERSSTSSHNIYDIVRGATKYLESDDTQAEVAAASTLSSFDADGFSVGNAGGINESGQTYVGWNWLAGGTGVSNTDGTITSTVSANTEAGFSIVTYTGTGANATVGHGLNAAPDVVIIKARNDTRDWGVYHSGNTSAPETDYLRLSATDATADDATVWNDTAPTSSVFSLGTAFLINRSTYNYVAYCFHNVEGYSKFGSYTGNGSTDGPFVYTGFRPAWLIVKGIDVSQNWHMVDNTRDTDNVVEKYLIANLSQAEATADIVDFLSNGFKLRNSAGSINTSGDTYIYMAFAEQPFKYSNAR